MAAAEAFLAPTKTGNWAEALGRVAGSVGQAQKAYEEENQQIAQQKFNLAGQGLQLERQRQADALYQQAMQDGSKEPAGGPLPGATPGGGASPQGIPIAPAVGRGVTREQFMLGEQAKGTPYSDAALKWAEFERKGRDVREAGVFQDGTFYPTPSGKTTSVRVYGPGGGKVYDQVPEMWAMKMSMLDPSDPEYIRLANMIIGKTGQPPQAAPGATPPTTRVQGAAPLGAPAGGVESVEEREARLKREASKLAISQEGAKALAKGRSEAAVTREAELPTKEEASRRIFGAASRVNQSLKESPNFFGIFDRPGVVAALGKVISQGVQTPAGTLNLAGFEDAIRQSMPKATQKDLDNVTRSAADLAEIELAYTQLYMQKQGAITEGERAIVRRLGGNVSNSPNVLKGRMMLLQARSQYDIDRISAYRSWQENNPDKTINDFDRTPIAKNLKTKYETKLGKMFGAEPALPSNKKKAVNPSQRLDEILGGQ
ncbi:MAG: hypothetical protein FGM60_04455 [Candidatus Planktophila sp.]|nr:hypothetical protein [Candidatus Planktophila sp.]